MKHPRVDLNKRYRTRDGREVELNNIVPRNSAGTRVTYPVKGAILSKTPTGRKRRERNIWTLAGRYRVGKTSAEDLIEENEDGEPQ